LSAAGAAVQKQESRPWLSALLWLAILTPFFFLTYGFANRVTGLRHNVPSLAFGWEHHIPFLAWTIVPYWTTDFFYGGALLLSRTRDELGTLVKRLIATQLLCVTGFLLVPLQFTFDRPHADGVFGQLFDALMSFDKPFNQAPSLHVALTTVLWAAYGRHFHGWVLWLIRSWFVLMALSTLTTYQHHFIDLPAGLWVGLFVTVLFPERRPKVVFAPAREFRRFRLGARYLLGAVACVFGAWWLGGAAWFLLWPAGALAIVTLIYWAGRPELFRKSEGAMAPAMIALLAPYLAAAWLNSRWHTRHQPVAREIAGGVWLGRIPRRAEREALGIQSIVDTAAELPVDTHSVAHRGIPMLDLLAPTAAQLDAAAAAIADFEHTRPTLVCCALGYSRSAAAIAAWLVATGHAASIDQAVEIIRARCPSIVLTAQHRRRLEEWARTRAAR
jgi:protein-tyrosine phosphatase